MVNDLANLARLPVDHDLLSLLRRGLKQFAARAAELGLDVVYLGPLPLTREARCTPEMAQSQRDNPSMELCAFHPREDTLDYYSNIFAMMREIDRTTRNFHLLDLFSLFCPGEVCGMISANGTLMFRDSAHPSVQAAELASSSLIDLIERIDARSEHVR